MGKLGIGLQISRAHYRAKDAARILKQLLGNSEYSENAARVGAQVRQENGVDAACDALEAELYEVRP
jgi:UDP:flavonoid glycosyltransferase YjiC (YdhE family)